MARIKLGLTTALLLAGAQVAYAADDLQINGFLNVTAGVLDTAAIQDAAATEGYDTTVGFDPQTLAGLQVAKKVNSNTTATIQLMSRGATGYDASAAWAYITYDLTDSSSFRFGRLRTPFFQYSDFIDVGYAYNWVTPPGIVYRLDSMANITGVDFTQRFTAGFVDGAVQLYTGRFKDDFRLYGHTYLMELRSVAGVALSANAGDFGGRLSYHRGEFYIDLDPKGSRSLDQLAGLSFLYDQATGVVSQVPNSGVAATNITPEIIPQGQQSQFYEGSLFWDNGSTSLVAEYTDLRHDSAILNDDNAWLVSAAQRIGDFTVHATYSQTEDSLKGGSIGTAQKLNSIKANSTTLGVRYDYNSSTAFKVEASYVTRESSDVRQATAGGAAATYTEALTNYQTPGHAAYGDAATLGAASGAFLTGVQSAIAAPLSTQSGTLFNVGMSIVF
jgi:hypothetical protein